MISLFVFLMQYLWVYIDEIIGKGAGLLLIVELIAYLSVSMMPLALPVAVLIGAVMTMGNLAEHYELSSMKSAGIPLLRVMLPLMICGVGISAFSFVCSNYLIPVANLKARTRLYDIRKQKPSLSLEEGTFNDDFQGFTIRIGEKAEDDQHLKDVMLFRQGSNLRGRLEGVTAEAGLMRVTPDERYFILELEDGYQYQEPEPEQRSTSRSYPFVRTKFGAYRKTFDLSEFEIERTEENAFQDHQTMLSVRQLAAAVDSIEEMGRERQGRLGIEIGRFITPLKRLDQVKQDSIDKIFQDSVQLAADLAFAAVQDQDGPGDEGAADLQNSADLPSPVTEGLGSSEGVRETIREIAERATYERPDLAPYDQTFGIRSSAQGSATLPLSAASRAPGYYQIDSANRDFYALLLGQEPHRQATYADRGLQFVRSIRSYTDGASRRLEAQQSSLASYVYELHLKFSFAIACFVFLFVGAPLGAIIRKGGFGYPVLASILLFATYVVLNIACKKLMRSFAIDAAMAAWLPIVVIFPIGLVLTYAAMNDRKFQAPSWLTDSRPARAVVRGYGKLLVLVGLRDPEPEPETSAA